jgi:hypothetical protein
MLAGCAYPVGLASSGCTEMGTTPWSPCNARTPAKSASSLFGIKHLSGGTSSSTCVLDPTPSDGLGAETVDRPDLRRAPTRTPPTNWTSFPTKDR